MEFSSKSPITPSMWSRTAVRSFCLRITKESSFRCRPRNSFQALSRSVSLETKRMLRTAEMDKDSELSDGEVTVAFLPDERICEQARRDPSISSTCRRAFRSAALVAGAENRTCISSATGISRSPSPVARSTADAVRFRSRPTCWPPERVVRVTCRDSAFVTLASASEPDAAGVVSGAAALIDMSSSRGAIAMTSTFLDCRDVWRVS